MINREVIFALALASVLSLIVAGNSPKMGIFLFVWAGVATLLYNHWNNSIKTA